MANARTVRWYRGDDREDLLSLCGEVYGGVDEDWFDWKYGENPYTDRVPVLVAERDGTVVGTVGFFVSRVGDGDCVAWNFQATDGMTHPEHRGQGVFTDLMDAVGPSVGRLVDDPFVVTGFPNDSSYPILPRTDVGAQFVAEVPSYVRVRDPGTVLSGRDGALSRAVGRVSTPFVRAYLGGRDRWTGRSGDASVRKHRDVPAETLARLYRSHGCSRIHGVREEQYYDWRFDDPYLNDTTYVAERDGTPVSSAVVETRTDDGITVKRVVDVLPLTGGDEGAFGSVVAAVLRDDPDADYLSILSPPPFGRSVVTGYGFHDDGSFPLSAFTSPTRFVVSPGPGASARFGGRDLSDWSNWRLAYGDMANVF
jgi:GNAT superfamily N-acetyltransferase